jgi:predicted nucleic acid-binding protein
MKPSLYIETTIPSFVVGEKSPVLVTAARQAVTRQWWEERRNDYRLHVSPLVERELSDGEAGYAQQRLALVAEIARLAITAEVMQSAAYFFAYLRLPEAAAPDAAHLAVASHYGVDYLLTWNLKHLANGQVRRALERLHDTKGIFIPTICTPDELLNWEDETW